MCKTTFTSSQKDGEWNLSSPESPCVSRISGRQLFRRGVPGGPRPSVESPFGLSPERSRSSK